MANPEHVEILKQGVEVWNRWRKSSPYATPDLKGINLSNNDLRGINFSRAILQDSEFCETNLREAMLIETDLTRSNMEGAVLNGADLSGAILVDCILRKTRLVSTLFSGIVTPSLTNYVFLRNAPNYLRGADFQGALLKNTTFQSIDLSDTKGLENLVHRGPSTIGIDTVYMSKGKLPESFLRGCGVPENFIRYILFLAGEAFEYHSCFISYSSKDQSFADRLHADLQNKGVRCWFAPEDMKIGDKIRDRIDQSIRLHDKLLLVLSEHSINSDWVEDEVESAYEQEKKRGKTVLFPIRLDDAVMDTDKAWAAKLRRSRHIGDFTKWKDHNSYQKAFDRLLRDLKAEPK